MSLGASNLACLVLCCLNSSFSCANIIGVQFLSSVAAGSSMWYIPIAVRSFVGPLWCLLDVPLCCVSVVCLLMVVLVWGLFPCQARYGDAQQLSMSSIGESSGLHWNLFQCGCWCLFGLISFPAAMLAASLDWSWALCISVLFGAVMMSVGHLNSCPVICLVCRGALLGMM